MLKSKLLVCIVSLTACTATNGGESSETGGVSLDDLIIECEAILACMEQDCSDERAAIEAWQEQVPTYEETCTKVCVDLCSTGSQCVIDCNNGCDGNPICAEECKDTAIAECIDTCDAEREAALSAWQAQSDANFAAMRACEETCYEAPEPPPQCGDETLDWCPIMVAKNVFEEAETTCDERLTQWLGD